MGVGVGQTNQSLFLTELRCPPLTKSAEYNVTVVEPPPPPPPEPGTAHLTGVVTGLFGRPVGNAKVTLNTQETFTLADGSYTFESNPLGVYTLSVNHWFYETYSEEIALTEEITYTKDISLKVKYAIKVSVATGAVLGSIGTVAFAVRRKKG